MFFCIGVCVCVCVSVCVYVFFILCDCAVTYAVVHPILLVLNCLFCPC